MFSVSHMPYLEANTQGCFLKYVFFQTQTHWIKIQTHYNDREDQHYHLSDVKLLYWQQHCDAYKYVIRNIKNILSQIVSGIYEYDFNVFSLKAQVRLLPKFFKKGSNLPSLYNWCLKLFKFLRLILVALATNIISELFP